MIASHVLSIIMWATWYF